MNEAEDNQITTSTRIIVKDDDITSPMTIMLTIFSRLIVIGNTEVYFMT